MEHVFILGSMDCTGVKSYVTVEDVIDSLPPSHSKGRGRLKIVTAKKAVIFFLIVSLTDILIKRCNILYADTNNCFKKLKSCLLTYFVMNDS